MHRSNALWVLLLVGSLDGQRAHALGRRHPYGHGTDTTYLPRDSLAHELEPL